VARLSKSRTANDAEFAVLVADSFQRRGIGTELLRRLVLIGRDEKLGRITGEILRDNHAMLRTSRNLGFQIDGGRRGGSGVVETVGTVEAYIELEE
jgi:acetyltransferase